MYKQFAAEISTILSLPEVYLRLHELMDKPNSNAEELGSVIRHDPGLSVRLLKIVNSSFYGFPSKIDNLNRAITIIGIQELENLVLATTASATFNKIPSDLIDMSCFWHHSVYVGITAKLLAKSCELPHTDHMFAAGLLHDVGQLIIFHKAPREARMALQQAQPTDDGLYQAEKEVLGFSHGDVGAELFRVWKLPPIFAEVAAFHHEPRLAKNFILETAIVHLANSLANTLEPARNITECCSNCDPKAKEIIGLSEQALTNILDETEAQFSDVIKIISPNAPLL